MRLGALSLMFVLTVATVSYAGQAGQEDGAPPLAPAEVQKLLDGYAIIQVQEFLGLNDSQYSQLLPKIRALQDLRRRNEQERLRLLQELRRLTNGRAGQAPENDVRDRVRALRDLQTRSVTEIERAYDAIDSTLDVRQQGRFRVFEQEIELRKLQLLMRARQANRANRPLVPQRAIP